MKFMFFNLMAIIAILYLVAIDGKPLQSVPDFLTFVDSKETADKGTKLAERARKKLASFKADLAPESPELQKPIVAAPVAPKKTIAVKAKAEPKLVEVALRPVNKVPLSESKLVKRAALKITKSKTPPKAPQKFMSRAERRRELNRLAHDMEMMFADKLSN